MEAGSRVIAISITATQQPKRNAHMPIRMGCCVGCGCCRWVLEHRARAEQHSLSGSSTASAEESGTARKCPGGSGTASAERQRHSKRQLAVGRQVPSESGMASAKGAARQVRERSGKRQVAEARQAPSEVSTASAERERHGKRRGGVAQQAQSGRGRNRC